MSEFRMPSLGADMDAGTLLEWLVAPGDAVHRGDIVAVVDTSKAEIEVEVFEDGVIDELLVPAGTKVPVGTVLAILRPLEGAPAEHVEARAVADHREAPATAPPASVPEAPALPPPAPVAEAPAPEPLPLPVASAVVVPTPGEAGASAAAAGNGAPLAPPPADVRRRPRVSPLARRIAAELGVDVEAVTGTGEEGAVTKADVERAASARSGATEEAVAEVPASRPTPPPPPTPEPLTKPPPASRAAEPPSPPDRQAAMREAIGALMARSKREIPHYYLQTQIDMTRALAWLEQRNLQLPVAERLLPSTLMLAAVAKEAAKTPAMNGFWREGAMAPAGAVHLGVAIALRGGGLIAPAIHDADRLDLDALMRALRELVARARGGRLRSSEMSDPTITVTNLGERGVDLVHGAIYPPQVALVGFGGLRERPWAQDGLLGVRTTVYATLAADHRASDGHTGSRFLEAIDRRLQRPEEL